MGSLGIMGMIDAAECPTTFCTGKAVVFYWFCHNGKI
jgi:N-acetylmuramic acid 6-phosphate (MurNAc-6-P) etherase